MTANKTYNVLFLCTGNSARSILAESLLSHWGHGKFHAFSAGSFPKGQVHPMALELLRRMKLPAQGFRSKSWDEFAAPGAPPIDFIFTVCDNAAGEVCPALPGKPMTAHCGIADPAAVEGTDAEKAFAFRRTLKELETRIKLFTSLPIESLDGMTLQAKLREIGKSSTATGLPNMLRRALVAEGLGSMLLAATVIGSGIMAERLAGGNLAVALLANTAATVAVLATLIALFGPVSGAHFNPAVSIVEAFRGKLTLQQTLACVAVQIVGCCIGALLAHAMFELPLIQTSLHLDGSCFRDREAARRIGRWAC